MQLELCAHCGAHVRAGADTCPHCTAARPTLGRTATAALLALALAAPAGCASEAEYGAIVQDVDEDGDGYFSNDDCDDADETVNPGATETAGDGIDSNCDGQDDT